MPRFVLVLVGVLTPVAGSFAQEGETVETRVLDRASSAVFFYSRSESAFEVHGQIELTYGPAQWTDADTAKLLAHETGTRTAIAPDAFATFDASCPVAIGGAKLGPGLYFLAFERTADGLALLILDPGALRADHRGPNALAATTGGRRVPLDRRTHGVTDQLAVMLERVRSESAAEVLFILGSSAFVARIDPLFDEFPANLQVGAATYERSHARAWSKDVAKPGRIDLTYGSPVWSSALDGALGGAPPGTRLRLGNNFFATLDTDRTVSAGEISVPAGHYYLALEKQSDDALALLLLDPAPIRAKHMNSNQTAETTGGIAIPLEWHRERPVAERLSIRFGPGDGDGTVMLTMHFGPHEVRTTLTLGS